MSSDSILHTEFVYRDRVMKHPLTGGFAAEPPSVGTAVEDGGVTASVVAVNLAVGLAAKAAESLIDAAAARLQAEAVTLEATIPLEGFYQADGLIAIDWGCLTFHDGTDPNRCAVKAVFQVNVSPDGTAFRFTVRHWSRKEFLRPSKQFFQRSNERDFAIKIEMLTPGSDGLGTRSVFFEHIFTLVEPAELPNLFVVGQQLPWLAVPRRPTPIPGLAPSTRVMPLNLRVTLIETTKPNQFAQWLQGLAKEKKGDITSVVKDAVRQAIDPGFAASQTAKQAGTAGTAYAAYKTLWDDLSTHHAARPKLADPATDQQKTEHAAAMVGWKAKFAVKQQLLEANRVVAKVGFDAADLPWPGDLPQFKMD
jgi:hypothetical protein